MKSEIVALKCPSCGNADTISAREAKFGYDFKCRSCGTSSVLIVDQKLHRPKPGERVCTECGRVASPQARFCRCGSTLVVSCPFCLTETIRSHTVCESCGGLLTTVWDSDEGRGLRRDHLLRGYFDGGIYTRDQIMGLADADPNVALTVFVKEIREHQYCDPNLAEELVRLEPVMHFDGRWS